MSSDPPAFGAERIVVPVDFSGESRFALETSARFGGEIHCVHVLFPLGRIAPNVSVTELTDDERIAEAKQRLTEITNDFAVAHRVVLIGTPGLEISDYAKQVAADLIVIPSHGYHGVKRLVLGSVAERVIRHAECSVLVLRRSDAE